MCINYFSFKWCSFNWFLIKYYSYNGEVDSHNYHVGMIPKHEDVFNVPNEY